MPKSTSPRTLRSLAGAPTQPQPLSNSALIVIDAQLEYASRGALPLPGLSPALAGIAQLQTATRSVGAPVIHIAHQGKTGGLFDPNHGARLIDETGPQTGEPVLNKSLPNAFVGTDLAAVLQQHKVTNLVLVGFMTHMCVSSTARAALDLGYITTVVSDATATRDLPDPTSGATVTAPDVHRAALSALADRFSIIASTTDLLKPSLEAAALAPSA